VIAKLPQRELDTLRAKAVAHDTALAAMKGMADRARLMSMPGPPANPWDRPIEPVHPLAWDEGWLACWTEINQAIVGTPAPEPVQEADNLPF
jgi:hypothetical protein